MALQGTLAPISMMLRKNILPCLAFYANLRQPKYWIIWNFDLTMALYEKAKWGGVCNKLNGNPSEVVEMVLTYLMEESESPVVKSC